MHSFQQPCLIQQTIVMEATCNSFFRGSGTAGSPVLANISSLKPEALYSIYNL